MKKIHSEIGKGRCKTEKSGHNRSSMKQAKATDAAMNGVFVTLLRRQRLSKGLTQTKLAKRLGLKSPSTVSFWESGQSIPSPELIPKLSRLLGVTAMRLTELLEQVEGTTVAK
jgi:ribosome-binding protein aMBF1 (putative translation factor)